MNIWSDNMFFLISQSGEFLIIAIVAVLVIAIGLLVYFIVMGKKQKTPISPNFETRLNNENQTNNQKNENEILQPEEPASNNYSPVDYSEEKKHLEDEKADNSIQILLEQMQSDLDKSNESYEDSISRYESDEEANAIISYKELMKYKESRDKDIILEEKDKEEIKEVIKENNIEVPKEEVKRFKRSEFISPIFGYNDETNVTYREIKRPPRKEFVTPNSDEEGESDRILKNFEDNTAEVIEFENNADEPKESTENDSFFDALVDFRNKLN